MSDGLVERVARAISLDRHGVEARWPHYRETAQTALEASGHAELLKCVRLLWQFHEPGDIPADLEILVPEVLSKYGDAS